LSILGTGDTEGHGAERLLFLDRDGTLNRTIGQRPPDVPEEVDLLPGVAPVLARYVAGGWRLIIVSNQGGVAGGYLSEAQAWAVQQRVIDLLGLPVAASYLCPHLPDGIVPEYAVECPNRKPNPGFILMALEQFGAPAEDCLFVGDSITDMQAAEAAGVPYRWADRFFGRPVDRGMHTRDGRWVHVREAGVEDVEALLALARETPEEEARWLPPDASSGGEEVDLAGQTGRVLAASMGGQIVGWLAATRGDARHEADLAFGVDPSYRRIGIGSLLMDIALEWAREQPGLRRLCVQVQADNLPVSGLCCTFGFAEKAPGGQGAAGDEPGLATLACYL
jgi:D-glycero-D-manno-heptose 1,7-bisphosphate phosphatase